MDFRRQKFIGVLAKDMQFSHKCMNEHSVERNSFEFFYLIVFLASMFSLLLVPCWFSSEMKRKSENIYLAIYSCPWVDASKNFKKDLIYFMHRTQDPIQFKAIGFFKISVDTFMSIVRSSFSYYAVLNKVNMKDEQM